jgi:hypothetical protein
MNIRIKELSEQAWKYTNDTISEREVGSNQDAFEEKFAELIVRECSSICEYRYSHNNADMSEGACEAMACCDAILEHFGVEEK